MFIQATGRTSSGQDEMEDPTLSNRGMGALLNVIRDTLEEQCFRGRYALLDHSSSFREALSRLAHIVASRGPVTLCQTLKSAAGMAAAGLK